MYFGDKAHGEINKILKKRSQKKIHFFKSKKRSCQKNDNCFQKAKMKGHFFIKNSVHDKNKFKKN